jgi:hypothetical protein
MHTLSCLLCCSQLPEGLVLQASSPHLPGAGVWLHLGLYSGMSLQAEYVTLHAEF